MFKASIKNIAIAIEKVTEGKSGKDLEAVMKSTVKFLDKQRLLSKKEEIFKELERIINQKESRIKMKVSSATKIPEHTKDELEQEMKEKYKMKEIESEYFEDKNLLGGMKIEVGEDVLDMTFRNKLNQLEKHLIH